MTVFQWPLEWWLFDCRYCVVFLCAVLIKSVASVYVSVVNSRCEWVRPVSQNCPQFVCHKRYTCLHGRLAEKGTLTNIGGSCHKYHFWHDKSFCLSRQNVFVTTKHVFCRDKIMFVRTNFCRDKIMFVMTNFCRYKHVFVEIKMIFA